MTAKLTSTLGSYKMVRAAWSFVYYLYNDFRRGKMRGLLLIGLGNLLPDLLSCSASRPTLWKLAGMQLPDAVLEAGMVLAAGSVLKGDLLAVYYLAITCSQHAVYCLEGDAKPYTYLLW